MVSLKTDVMITPLKRKYVKGWCRVLGVNFKWWWSTKYMRKKCLSVARDRSTPPHVSPNCRCIVKEVE